MAAASRGAGRPRRSPSTESRRYGGLGLAGGGRRATGTLGAADSQQAGHADKVRRLHIPPPHRCGSALNCAALIGLRVPALHVLGGPAPRHLRHTVTHVATPSSPTSFARLVRNPTLIVASAARGSLIASPATARAGAVGGHPLVPAAAALQVQGRVRIRGEGDESRGLGRVLPQGDERLRRTHRVSVSTPAFFATLDREERGRAQVSRKCCLMRWVTPLRALHTKCLGC